MRVSSGGKVMAWEGNYGKLCDSWKNDERGSSGGRSWGGWAKGGVSGREM